LFSVQDSSFGRFDGELWSWLRRIIGKQHRILQADALSEQCLPNSTLVLRNALGSLSCDRTVLVKKRGAMPTYQD